MGLVAVRALFTLYTVSVILIDIAYNVNTTNSASWLKYLTNWNYFMVVCYFATAFVVTGSEVLSLRKQKSLGMLSGFADSDHMLNDVNKIKDLEQNGRSIISGKLKEEYASYSSFSRRRKLRRLQHVAPRDMTCSFKLVWVLHNVAITMTATIVAGYWTVVHDYSRELSMDLDTFLTIDSHGINLLLLILDFFVNKIPFRVLHFIHPFLLACIYVVFHIVYWATTDDIVYAATDWKNEPAITVLSLVGFLLVIFVFHFILYLLYCTVIQSDCKTKIGFFMVLLVLLFVTLAILTFVI